MPMPGDHSHGCIGAERAGLAYRRHGIQSLPGVFPHVLAGSANLLRSSR